ncbi:sulfatase [Paramyrothecium foliicola]|nr:sulfatase [Paramyrothecium foliicola]
MSLSAIPPSACTETSIPIPSLPGAEILSLSAIPVLNYTATAAENFNYNHPTIRAEGIDFCNITITYTHPGQQDSLGIETWLPLKNWNGRIQSVGGGGWVAGRFFLSYQAMNGAIAEGYVTSSIDAGLSDKAGQVAFTPDEWAMVSEGNVNLYNLQNFGSVSLNDQSIIVKALTKDFYGRPHDYAYWSGCSQGGRQGYMLAQRYPDAYDGIAAAAPAIYIPELFMSNIWAHIVMEERGESPPGCEFEHIRAAAIRACDSLDGRVDGLISNEAACQFDPMTVVGQSLNCSDIGKMTVVSETAAIVAAAAWAGPRTPEGEFLWYGVNRDARLAGDASGAQTSDVGMAQTFCQNGTCHAAPGGLGDKWISLFLRKNSSASWQDVTAQAFVKLYKQSVREYDSLLGTSDGDLSEFRAAGGKMITYHGTADGIIPIQQMYHYYDSVLKNDADAADFYRLFTVPGLAHCSGGNGGQPTATWAALVAWVENGKAPDTLPIRVEDTNGTVSERQIHPYPNQPYSSGCTRTNRTCDTSRYGSEIKTPALARLAEEGLRMTNFHTASACSPTRSMLFSGTDSHIAGLGCMWEHMQMHKEYFQDKAGCEGYLNYRVAALPEILADAGYLTMLAGKWHLGLTKEFAPCSRGFKKNFSFLPGSGNHFGYEPQLEPGEIFFPALCTDGHWMEGDNFLDHRTDLGDNLFSTVTFTDKLIGFLKGRSHEEVEEPFFASGMYDAGPDVLTRSRVERLKELGLVDKNAEIPPPQGKNGLGKSRENLDLLERQRSAKTMEIYAAMVQQMDENIDRVLAYLKSIEELDDTFVLFMSDNGAEGAALEALPIMGGPRSMANVIEKYYNNSTENLGRKDSFIWYGPRWANAGTAPNRGVKSMVLEGGIRCPCIIRYPPLQPEPGSVSHSFTTVMDILPTVLDLAMVKHPGGSYRGHEVALPRGKSWSGLLKAKTPNSVSVHGEDVHIHGWELFGQRAIRKGCWKALWLPNSEATGWELYNLQDDPAELHDDAGQHPELLDELILYWDQYVSETGMIATPMWAKKQRAQ